MAERGKGFVGEQRVLHSVRNIEAPLVEHLETTDRAQAISSQIQILRFGSPLEIADAGKNLTNTFKNGVDTTHVPDSEKPKNYSELVALVRVEYDARNAGSAHKISDEDLESLMALEFDLEDGAALGVFNVLSDDTEMYDAVVNKDNAEVARLLGVDSLAGIEDVVVNTAVTDPRLMKALNALGIRVKSGNAPLNVYESAWNQIQDWYAKGEVNDDETVMVLTFLNSVIQGKSEGVNASQGVPVSGSSADQSGNKDIVNALMNVLEVPHDPNPRREVEIQLQFAREYLHRIEISQWTINDEPYHNDMARLDKVLDQFRPEVQREISARLSMDFCARAMRASQGRISSKGELTMGSAANFAMSRRKDPDGEKMQFLFDTESSSNGLPFKGAWDWIQYANFNYLQLLEQMGTQENITRLRTLYSQREGVDLNSTREEDQETIKWIKRNCSEMALLSDLTSFFDNDAIMQRATVNFHSDKNITRKKLVGLYVVDHLTRGLSPPDPNCTWRQARAEHSLAEQAFDMATKAAEGLGETNVANAPLQQGSDDLAELIGFDKYRFGKIPRTAAGPVYHQKVIDTIPGATSWIRQLDDEGAVSTKKPLYSHQVEWRKAAPGDYQFYYTVTLGKVDTFVKEYLLNIQIKPSDLLGTGVNNFRNISHLADKAEKPGTVVSIAPDRPRIPVVGTNGGKYVEYNGRRLPVIEPARTVEGISNAKVSGRFVSFPNADGSYSKPVRIDYAVSYPTDPNSGEQDKVVSEIVRDEQGRVHNITPKGKAFVEIPGVGRRYVERSNQGSRLLRVRFLQTLAETWSLNEGLGASFNTILELGKIVSRDELWPGQGTFVTPYQWKAGVLEEKAFDLAGRFGRMEADRRKKGRTMRSTGPIRL